MLALLARELPSTNRLPPYRLAELRIGLLVAGGYRNDTASCFLCATKFSR